MRKKTKTMLLCIMTAAMLGCSAFAFAACNESGAPVDPNPTPPPVGDDDPPTATISFSGLETVYDGTNKEVTATVSPAAAGTVTVTYWQDDQEVYRCVNAGSYTVKATVETDDYTVTPAEATFVIAPKPLEVDGITPSDIFYDGTSRFDATKTGAGGVSDYKDALGGYFTGTAELKGIVSGDNVEIDTIVAEADVSAYGADRAVSLKVTLKGTSADNYTVPTASDYTADVYPVSDGVGLIPVYTDTEITSWSVGRYVGSEKEIEIPAEYNDVPVTEILQYTFIDKGLTTPAGVLLGVTKITIPGSITKIGRAMAQNNTTLEELVFSDREAGKTITWDYVSGGAWTVAGCPKLRTVTFGANFTEIPNTFAQDSALTTVTINEGVTKIGAFAFFQSKLTEVTIPASVTEMGNAVFQGCGELQTATFVDRDHNITFTLGDMEGSWMFFLCNKLETLTIGDGITSLPKIFAPTNAVTVHIGKDLATLGSEAFPNGKTVRTLWLDSSALCTNTVFTANGFFANATTIYLKDGVSACSYITTNYTVQADETAAGYQKYVKNS